MGKPYLLLIISFAVITVFINSAHVINSQSMANLSTTWINNYPRVLTETGGISALFESSNSDLTTWITSGFFCIPEETSCFFGITIFGIVIEFLEYNGGQVVWLANRDRPVGVNATLKLTGDGDLILQDADGDFVWSTNTAGKSVTGLRLTEQGNLVLFDSKDATVWQSFDHPTDTLLVGQKLDSKSGQKLIASKSSSDVRQGLFSISIHDDYLVGYVEATPPLVYCRSTLLRQNLTDSEKVYFALEDGLSIIGHSTVSTIALGSKPYFMRLEPDGHLKIYEWGGDHWTVVMDLLSSDVGDCGYPIVCGRYGICSSNGQCGCFGSSSETEIFKQLNSVKPNLGCSLVTPISCNLSQYQSLLELKNTSYFNFNWEDIDDLGIKVPLEDCKNACLRNCSCKAALYTYGANYFSSPGGCLLLSDMFSLIYDEGPTTSVFLKVQSFPKNQSSPPRSATNQTSSPRSQPSSPRSATNQSSPPSATTQSSSPRSGTIILGSSLGALFGICLLAGSCILASKSKRKPEELDEFSVDKVPGMPTRFAYSDLKTATNDFNNKLGEGGFGSVFQGMLSDGTIVAVKRLASLSQIKKSFLAEVQTIGSIHHVNLVRLIGFCAENSNMLLVYEYMSNGSLDRWIFERRHQEFKRNQEPTLGWESRRKIITDIAKGLAYLHEGCRQKIYHLDVKPQNILLNENFEAKVSDFGLAKLIDKDQSRVVATLRGTPGYMAPEWLSSIITEKVDVYSFGVVVLEILCGRKNLDRSQPEEEKHLLGLFERKGEEGQLLDMVDKDNVDMQLHGAEVVEMMKLTTWCLQSDYQKRPSMTLVVHVLEGFVSVQDDLDFNFINAPVRRTITTFGDGMDAVHDGTTLFASNLSGPR